MRYGDAIVTEVKYGASLRYFTSVNTNLLKTDDELKIAACLSFGFGSQGSSKAAKKSDGNGCTLSICDT